MSTTTTAPDASPSSSASFTAISRRSTSLRKKTFLTVAGTLVTLIVILSLSLSWILVGRFNKVEMHDSANEVQIAGAALSSYFDSLRTSGIDWSAWDESYQFVQDGNAAYRQANLTAFGLSNLQVDVIAFVQPNGHITFGTGVDRANGTLYPLPSSLTALFTPSNLLVQAPSADRKVSGFLSLPEGTLLVVADPIVHDNGSGASRGAFIIGRYLSKSELTAVQNEHRLKSLVLEPRSAPNLPPTMTSAAKQLVAGNTTVVQPVNSGLMLASTLIPDVFGKPSFILQAGVDRSTYQEAQRALHYLVIALVVAGLVILGLMLLLIERLVLRRLATVSQGVESIGSRRDLTMRLNPDGSDEIGQLASAINQMLQDLEDAQGREHRLNEQIAELHIQIDEARRDREVERITDSDYFRGLTERAETLRRRSVRTTNTTA